MTLKQAIDIAIESGMTEFTVSYYQSDIVYPKEQTLDSIYEFIKGYENSLVMSLNLGTNYSHYNFNEKRRFYSRPTLCHISIRDENEPIPTE